jgi:hypothetical protein
MMPWPSGWLIFIAALAAIGVPCLVVGLVIGWVLS